LILNSRWQDSLLGTCYDHRCRVRARDFRVSGWAPRAVSREPVARAWWDSPGHGRPTWSAQAQHLMGSVARPTGHRNPDGAAARGWDE